MRSFWQPLLFLLLPLLLFGEEDFPDSLPTHRTLHLKNFGISNQNLLHIQYFSSNKEMLSKTAPSSPESLRILGIRVSFQPDTLSTTTGDGTFILTSSDTTIIDPPPHDREYFLAQIEAISHYFKTVSNKKLLLTGEVFPFENEVSYMLPHRMDYYHPDAPAEEQELRLAELFQDALLAADSNDQIDFSSFDIFVVFHAGVGQDFADELDTTPNDIPSAFLNFDRLKKLLGNDDPGYSGIQTSTGLVKEGIILPETENQDGSEFAVKGTFALYMGNQLGLPSLYNTRDHSSGIGAWGLMDVGSSNYFGLIPAAPCAWSKVFLGWEEPVLLAPGTDIRLAVLQSRSAPHIYKIPINAREYFLLENRNTDYNHDQIVTGSDQFGHRLEFNPLGNFTAQIDTAAGERLGVVTKVFDYDFSIPGSGILIWHIDDRIIEQNYRSNRVNADPEHRGVDLEEADGSQDIGQNYAFLSPGSGSEFGVAEDAYFQDNEVHKTANKSDEVTFSPLSSPASHSNSEGITGIRLFNFSTRDSVMNFDFANSLQYPGFPQRFAGDVEIKLPPVVSGENKADGLIFFTPGNSQLFAWKSDGSPLIPTSHPMTLPTWDEKSTTFQIALFDTVTGAFSHFPVITDVNHDGKPEVIAAANRNRVLVWSWELDPGTGFARRLYQIREASKFLLGWNQRLLIAGNDRVQLFDFDAQGNFNSVWRFTPDANVLSVCLTSQMNSNQELVVLLKNQHLLKIDRDGQLLKEYSLPFDSLPPQTYLISGFLRHDQPPAVLIASGVQVLALSGQFVPLDGFPLQLGQEIVLQPVITDLDLDGNGELVVVTKERVFAFNHNGTYCSGFPVELPVGFTSTPPTDGSPLALFTSDNGYIFVRDGANNLVLFQNDGMVLRDFILSGGGKSVSPFMSLADLNHDGWLEVIEANSDGLLTVRQLSFSHWNSQSSWLQTPFDATGSRFNPNNYPAVSPSSPSLLEYAFNYPNPTRGNQTTFRFLIHRDAEIKLEIYDLGGERIQTLTASGEGMVENEITWNLDNVESGIYMARLEAYDGREHAHKMIKVAVVK